MGRDKALIEVAGEALVQRVARALRAAGAQRVIVVGGDRAAIEAFGLDVVADLFPGEGPLGGVLTAMAGTDAPVLAVLGTDLLNPDPDAIRAVLGALTSHDVAVPVAGGRRHFHHAVWSRSAEARLDEAFREGERAIKRAIRTLAVAEVDGIVPAALADADTPDELPPEVSPRAAR
jgi:molybdopterin-guanine dinucleotide biosynthesis protein A